MARKTKWIVTLVAVTLVFGLVLGVGQAAADSLPGEPLYGLKLATEEIRLRLTSNGHAKANLTRSLAEERLGEIAVMAGSQKSIDGKTVTQAQKHLSRAFESAAQIEASAGPMAFQQLMTAIETHERAMVQAANELPESEQSQVRELLRAMQQVRQRANEEAARGEQLQRRLGTPPDASELPDPNEQPGPGPNAAGEEPGGPNAGDEQPGPGEPSGPNTGDEQPGPGEPSGNAGDEQPGPGEPGGPNTGDEQPGGPNAGDEQPGAGPQNGQGSGDNGGHGGGNP
jgi:hypothetical protein